jgi:hypothetical protein
LRKLEREKRYRPDEHGRMRERARERIASGVGEARRKRPIRIFDFEVPIPQMGMVWRNCT